MISKERIETFEVETNMLEYFLNKIPEISESIDNIPAERYRAASILEKSLGEEFMIKITSTLKDRNSGAVVIKFPKNLGEDELKILFISLAYLIGTPRTDSNFNPISIFKGDANHDFLNLNTSTTLPLHTDGTYYNGNTDWLAFLVQKSDIKYSGGEPLLLHIDDWLQDNKIKDHPMFRKEFVFKGPSINDSKKEILGHRGDLGQMILPIFYESEIYGACCRVAHQWIHPRNKEEADFVLLVIDSLKEKEKNCKFKLDRGNTYIINNRIWLHGRSAAINSYGSRLGIRAFGEFMT